MILRKVYKKREKVRNYSITFSPCLFFSCNEINHSGKCYTRRYSFSFTSQILHQFLPSPVESLISVFIDTPKKIHLSRKRFQHFPQFFRIAVLCPFIFHLLDSSLQDLVLLHQLVVMMEQDFYLLLVGQVFVHFIHIINTTINFQRCCQKHELLRHNLFYNSLTKLNFNL